MNTNTQTPCPDTLETALQIVDRILLEVLQDPKLKPADKIRAITLFYKRHQVGGFAPRAWTGGQTGTGRPARGELAPHSIHHLQIDQLPPPTKEQMPHNSKPAPPLPQHHPAAHSNAHRDAARTTQTHRAQRRR